MEIALLVAVVGLLALMVLLVWFVRVLMNWHRVQVENLADQIMIVQKMAEMLDNYVDFLERQDSSEPEEPEDPTSPDDEFGPWKSGEAGELRADIRDLPEPEFEVDKGS